MLIHPNLSQVEKHFRIVLLALPRGFHDPISHQTSSFFIHVVLGPIDDNGIVRTDSLHGKIGQGARIEFIRRLQSATKDGADFAGQQLAAGEHVEYDHEKAMRFLILTSYGAGYGQT